MDLILEPDGKLASLSNNNNNSSSSLNNNNNNNILNNNNNPLIKGHGIKSSGEGTAAAAATITSPSSATAPPTSSTSTENNNHLTIISNSPTAVSPTPNGEAVYEFGRDFGENPSHVISEKVRSFLTIYRIKTNNSPPFQPTIRSRTSPRRSTTSCSGS